VLHRHALCRRSCGPAGRSSGRVTRRFTPVGQCRLSHGRAHPFRSRPGELLQPVLPRQASHSPRSRQ
jgi:hypothetical protein